MKNKAVYGLCITIVAGLYFLLPYISTLFSGHTGNTFAAIVTLLASLVIRVMYMLGLDVLLIILPLAYFFIRELLNNRKAYFYLFFQLIMFVPITINNQTCYKRFLKDFYSGPFDHRDTQRFHMCSPPANFTGFIIYSFKLPMTFLKWVLSPSVYPKDDNVRTLKYYMPGMAIRFDVAVVLLIVCILLFIYKFSTRKSYSGQSD